MAYREVLRVHIAEVVRRWQEAASGMWPAGQVWPGIPSASRWHPPLGLGWPGKDLTVGFPEGTGFESSA